MDNVIKFPHSGTESEALVQEFTQTEQLKNSKGIMIVSIDDKLEVTLWSNFDRKSDFVWASAHVRALENKILVDL